MKNFALTIIATMGLLLYLVSPGYSNPNAAALTLDEVLHHAAQTNPAILAARQELMEVEELYPQARAGWLPSLSAEASIYATDIESSNFSQGDGATTKDYTLLLDQPIFRGGRTFADTARAKYLIQAGEATLQQSEQSLYLRTVNAYMNLLRDAEIYSLRKSNQESLQKELNATQERYDLGDTTITDVHQARQRYQRAQSETVRAIGAYEGAQAVFEEETGLLPNALMRPVRNFAFPASLDGLIAMGEENNPSIWIAKYSQLASEEEVNSIFRELFPQISAFASYNKQYDPQPGIVPETETETIGLRATLALYQGGATRSRVRESKHAAKRLEYEIEDITRNIRQEVRSDWHDYLAARQELDSRRAEIESASLALEGVREEARLGQRTTLDILDAERELTEAKILLAQAMRNEIVAQYTLASRIGLLGRDMGGDKMAASQ